MPTRPGSLPVLAMLLLFSAPSYAQNTALSFNGSSTYVSTTAYIVPVSGDFTVEFWTYLPSVGSGIREFLSQGSSVGGQNFYIGTDAGTGNIRVGDPWQNSTVAMPVNQWVHIAVTRSGTTVSLYLNGILKASTSGYTISTGGSFFKIGNQYGALTEFINGTMDEVRVWNVARTAAQIKQGMYGTVSTSSSGLVAYYKMNEGSGPSLGNSTATTGLDGTLVNSPAWVSSPIQYASNAVNFDGVNDQVNIPANASYDLSSGTIECWINPGTIAGNATILGNRGATGTRYSFHMSTSVVGLWNNAAFLTVPFASVSGTWYHLAFVTNGVADTTGVFINGNYTGKLNGSFNTSLSGLPLTIGIAKNSGADGEPFSGSIDEVRIWNTMRTPVQIQANMNNTLTGSESGLVGLFSFDQGNPAGTNSNLITALDGTANNNHGTLTNFTLTGSSSNFVTHALTPLPVTFMRMDVQHAGDKALIQWTTAQEQNSRDFNVERSGDAKTFISIGTVAAAGNSALPRSYSFTDDTPLPGKNYYRLKESDLDGRLTYSAVKVLSFTAQNRLLWHRTGDNTADIRLEKGSNEYYSLTDMSGRVLQQGRLSAGTASLRPLPGGVYVVKVWTDAGTQQCRISIP